MAWPPAWWPSFSGCRLTNLELTTRHSRFGINTAVVPAPIENFFYFNDPLFIMACHILYGKPYCNDAPEGVGGITPPKLNRGG